jgi:C1A family cysteine protease
LLALDRLVPQHFYEYASSYDEVLQLLYRQKRLYEAGVPKALLDSVSLGVEWFDSGLRAHDGRLSMPRTDDPYRGRHRVEAIGFEDGGATLRFGNSWGAWGDQGTGYMPREYFDAHVDDVFVQRSAQWGPSPAGNAVFHERGSHRQNKDAEAAAWRTRNDE